MSIDNDEPVLSLENVEVEFDDESAIMEAIPESIKEWAGWQSGGIRAVDDVSIDIGEKDTVAVIGESGSGKTTLGKTAIALQKPTGGSVKYRGHDLETLRKNKQEGDLYFDDARRALQIVHQDPEASLNPYRTIMTILKEPLRRWFPDLSHADCRERILRLFQEVGLTPPKEYEDRYPHELSGGEQQRVSLIRAMLLKPDLILADEPVSALDPSLGIELMDLMLELQEVFDTSYLFISHSLENARYFASQADGRLAVMYRGKLVEIGPVEEVLQNPKHPYTKTLKWATLSRDPDQARAKLEEESPLRTFDDADNSDSIRGCRFHPRCPKAKEACLEASPELSDDDSHRVACYRESDDHGYRESEYLDERGEIEIPE